MRIIAGSHRGARIFAPQGTTTRPDRPTASARPPSTCSGRARPRARRCSTSSPARARWGSRRSRAAPSSAVFVESRRATPAAPSSRNLDKLRPRGRAPSSARTRSPRSAPTRRAGRRYDLVLVDPPYRVCRRSQAALTRYLPRRPRGRRAARRRDRRATRAGAAAGAANEPPLRRRAPDALRAPAVITAIYPGTYDPVTNGHVDVITRAAGDLRPRASSASSASRSTRQPMFTLDERVALPRARRSPASTTSRSDVFSELVVDFAHKWDAKVIVKGLRVISDFEWEFQMNQLNRTLAPDIETVYVMASPQRQLRLVERREGRSRAFGGKRGRARARGRRAPASRSSSRTAGPAPRRTRRNERHRQDSRRCWAPADEVRLSKPRSAGRAAEAPAPAAASELADRLESQLAHSDEVVLRSGEARPAARRAARRAAAAGSPEPTRRGERRQRRRVSPSGRPEPEPERPGVVRRPCARP